MNLLFFLTPKAEVAYVNEADSMRQIFEKMEHHGYTAVPILSGKGEYLGTITEGDLLWEMKERNFPPIKELEDIAGTSIKRHRDNLPVHVQENIEDLIDMVMNQNFVPVVDDNKIFIGIITRKDILSYMTKRLRECG